MRVKTIIDERFDDYRKPSMFICAISCCGKCCTEAGLPFSICQNYAWNKNSAVCIPDDELCQRYLSNPITQAVVIGGLEPFEEFDDLADFIVTLRLQYKCCDDIVIYTGYNRDEIYYELDTLRIFSNIIVKFGRYIPYRPSRYDETLGVTLASDNQYAEKIS